MGHPDPAGKGENNQLPSHRLLTDRQSRWCVGLLWASIVISLFAALYQLHTGPPIWHRHAPAWSHSQLSICGSHPPPIAPPKGVRGYIPVPMP